MNASISHDRSELRMSLKPMVVGLSIPALLLVFLSDTLSNPSRRFEVVVLALLYYALAGLVWMLDGWRPDVGKWFTIISLIGVVHLTSLSLRAPEALFLAVIPPVLAAGLIGVWAGVGVALGESALIVALLVSGVATFKAPLAGMVLVTIWSVIGVVYGTSQPVHQLLGWYEEYFVRAQQFFEEAQDRKLELEKTMESLGHANYQLALASQRMSALRALAEDANRSKAAFVAKVSHEFRTPLNIIIGLVELMVEAPEINAMEISPEMEKDLDVILRNCRHLSGMIDDVLDLTRMESGRVTLHREWADLGEIANEAAAVVLPLVQKKGLSLRIAAADDLPAVYCDRARIRQVLLNLLSNAARFTERGGITIEMRAEDHRVAVAVIDTGPGVRSEDAERIFEPFSQGASDVWRDKGGSGLGLSICRQFVRLHQGRLWLESELGVGSRFIFELPISHASDHATRAGHWIREDWVWREEQFEAGRAGLADRPVRPRVVLYDETGAVRSDLARQGAEVDLVEAADPAAAVREARRCPADVLMLNAASVDGLRAWIGDAEIRAPGTPVVACRAPAQERRAAAAGAVAYLTKPVSRTDLAALLDSLGRPVQRILLVDDDAEVLDLFIRMLYTIEATLEVETASCGGQALIRLREEGFDLTDLHALMAPRPFLVSGGAEDPPGRWAALRHAVRVNALLGATNRVAMTNRLKHAPCAESNEQIYRFLEQVLRPL